MKNDPKVTLEQANAAITAGNYEGFLDHCTDDTVWNFVGEQVLKGKDEVRAYMAKTYQEPPKFRVKQLIADADHVVANGEITLKNADGMLVDYSYCDVWELKDGKLHALNAYVLEQKGDSARDKAK